MRKKDFPNIITELLDKKIEKNSSEIKRVDGKLGPQRDSRTRFWKLAQQPVIGEASIKPGRIDF